MSTEEQEILKKIQHLSGRINRHKQRQRVNLPPPSTTSYSAGAPSNGPTGDGSALPSDFRHPNATDSDGGATSDASGSSWITRSDRHIQLINTSAYKSDSLPGLMPINPGRVQRPRSRTERGTAKLRSRLHHVGQAGHDSPSPPNPDLAAPKYTIVVEGIRFSVANGGKKLVKLPGELNQTPKTAYVSGTEFRRTKNGNLIRTEWHRQRHHTSRAETTKLNVPCKYFSTTGSCPVGPRCYYQHDSGKVAICKAFFPQDHCPSGESCDLSHTPTPERVPTCVHYAKGLCSNPNCLYAHVDLAPNAQNCRPFGLYGYCDKGASCPDRHSFECPDFSNTGSCNAKGCKLMHRERASVLRKAAASAGGLSSSNNKKNSSAHSGGVSSDDVGQFSDIDSDEIDEFIMQDESHDNDFVNQSDYIKF